MNNRQRVFVEEYLKCWNASEAARRAGYSEKGLRQTAHKLLTRADISAEITQHLKELQIGADEVLVRLTEQARGSMADFINPKTGTIDLVKAEKAGKLQLIKSFRRSTGKTRMVSVELYDAQAALVQLGKHLKLFSEEVQHTGELTIRYVNNWRNTTADATPGPDVRDETGETVQPAEGGQKVA